MLVVLGDAAFGAHVRDAVESAGFRAFVVADGRDARVLIRQGLDPCVILFALGSADEGRDFVARLAADAPTAAIPVIFFTAHPPGAESRAPIVSALAAFVQSYCASSSARNGSFAVH